MSSQNQATSETTRLLGDSQLPSQSSRILSRERFRFSPEILLIPVALATKLATLIPSTTLIELIRRVVCRFWNISHGDPAPLPPGGSTPPELCNAPEIEWYFATVIAVLGATEGIISAFIPLSTATIAHKHVSVMAGCGITSRISSHYGRKSAFLLALIAGFMGNCLIPGSQYMPDWLAGWVFLVGILLELFSGPCLYAYLVNMYIVDVCVPEDRYG